MTQLLSLAVLTLIAPEPPSTEAARAELARHQGTWAVTSFVREGKATPDEVARSIVRVVEGDHVVWKREGKSFAGTGLSLDPAASPAAIDVIPDGGRTRGEHVLGIYRLEGDTLTICMSDPGRPRPTAFEAPAKSGHTLMTFRRVKPGP